MKRWVKYGLCLWLGVWLGIFPVLSVPALAQEQDLVVVVDDIIMDRYADEQEVQVYVTVRHPQVGAVEDLKSEDFTLTISGGQPFAPDTAEIKEDAVVSLAIVLELYQSMRGKPLDDAKAAIKHLCTSKPPQDRVALFSVRHDVDPDSTALDEAYEYAFTEDGGAVDNFTQNLQVVSGGGGTPLYDTMVRALRFTSEISKEPVGRRAVVVITDGGDVGSRYNDQTVIDVANRLKVPVYAIGYTGQNRNYDRSLNEIANRTGGDYQNTPDSADFEAFLDDVRQTMSKHYLLTYHTDSLQSGRQILEVRVDASGMVGTASRVFEVGSVPAPATSAPATTTPQPPDSGTAAPSDSATAMPPTQEPETTASPLSQILKDYFWFILLGVGLFVILIAVLLLLRARRRKPAPSSWPAGGDQGYYTPTPVVGPDYTPPYSDVPFGGSPTPATGASWSPTGIGEPASPTEVAMGGMPYAPQATPPPPAFTPTATPTAAQPIAAQPVAPPQQERTLLLDRRPKAARALLVAQDSDVEYPLDQPATNIGRASENQIKLLGEKISRRHATIKIENDLYRIYDLGSANGTFVNGNRVRDPVELQDGDVIRLGDTAFIFKRG
ncbi:MAG: VWA domain-containing protein [Anaerolineae bacterium]|nr:VWA domain-containing protein [Anaerolineae bacterium]